MAGHFDDGLVVLLQRAGDVVEHRVELRLHFGLVEGERHAAGHVEGAVVALAHDVHAGALHLATQSGLLAVLLGADVATGPSANARPDPRALAAFGGVAAAEPAGDHPDAGRPEECLVGRAGVRSASNSAAPSRSEQK